jgi:hypothetical protein
MKPRIAAELYVSRHTYAMSSYSNTLELNHKPKDIPYGGTGELREDGDANYGFKYIKGNEQLLL